MCISTPAVVVVVVVVVCSSCKSDGDVLVQVELSSLSEYPGTHDVQRDVG